MARKKMGRPEKEINQKQFEQLCALQCTEVEVCAVLDVDEATLNKWCRKTYSTTFSQVFKEKRLGGRASLRRRQWQLAEKSAAMAIWLGKQYLGQKDVVENNTVQEVIFIKDDLDAAGKSE